MKRARSKQFGKEPKTLKRRRITPIGINTLPKEIFAKIFEYTNTPNKTFQILRLVNTRISNIASTYVTIVDRVTIKVGNCPRFNKYNFTTNFRPTNFHIQDRIARDKDLIKITSKYIVKTLNVSSLYNITDEFFPSLKDVKKLNISNCKQDSITDEGFKSLKGIRILKMANCTQKTITDQAFSNLKGIDTLFMNCCNQPTISNKAFKYLKGIRVLHMPLCTQNTITDEAINHLKGNLEHLDISYCNINTMTVRAFNCLKGLKKLGMANLHGNRLYEKAANVLKDTKIYNPWGF